MKPEADGAGGETIAGAGETPGAGKPAAAAPEVEPEVAAVPVEAADVPPIDEAAHVVGGGPEPVSAADVPVALREALEGDSQMTGSATPDGAPTVEEDSESAAMRAIEGGWTPRAVVEPTQPAPAPEMSRDEIEAAMKAARQAVANAAAAAETVVADAAKPAAPPPRELAFEVAGQEGSHGSFLDRPATAPTLDGMDFETDRSHRQGPALPSPEPGGDGDKAEG